MEQLGAQFKHAREGQGLSLQAIATKTKISVTVLEAVERNDFSRLPGGIFGRSFVRAYAAEVGLDPDVAVSGFVEELERSEREAAARGAVRPEITPDDERFLERQRRALFWLRIGIVAFVVIALGAAAWALRGRLKRASQTSSTETISAPASDTPAPAPSMQAPDSAAVSAPPAVAGAVPGPAVALAVEIAVSGDCWIWAAIDGTPVVSQLYRSGDKPRFEGVSEVLLEIGNAGVAAMSIGGKPAKALGANGTKVKLRITPENAASWLR